MNRAQTVWTASTTNFDTRRHKGKGKLLIGGELTGINITLNGSSSRLVESSQNGPVFSNKIDDKYPGPGDLVVFTGPHDWDGKSPCTAHIWGSKSLWDKYQEGGDTKHELTVIDGGKGEDDTEVDGSGMSPMDLFRSLTPPATGRRVQGYHTGRHH